MAPILMAPQNVPMNSGASRQSMRTRCSISTPSQRRALPVRLTSPWTWADEPADDQQRVRGVRPLGEVRGEHRLARLHEAPDVVRAGEEGLEADDVLHGATGGLHDGADILERLPRLRLDVRAGQLARAPSADLPCDHDDLPGRGRHPVRVHAERLPELPRRDDPGHRGLSSPAHASRTYSKSTGWPLTPRAGGAIQLANLPRSVTGCIRLWMYASSAGVGSHSCFFAPHSASVSRRPSGDTRTSVNTPILRWKARCGSLSSKSTPCSLMIRFQRSTPRWQSAM